MSDYPKKTNASVLIVGTGALATLFAARLSAAGIYVSILGTWETGLAALKNEGAHLDRLVGKPVKVGSNPSDFQSVKYAFVLVKSWQTERAGHQLKACLAEDGLAVSLQNGLGNDETLAEILGQDRVAQGITTIGATLLRPAYAHLGGEGQVMLERSDQTEGLEALLQQAKFQTMMFEDMKPQIWGKLAMNAAINPVTALLGVKNADLLEIPSALGLMKGIAEEVVSVAEAHGITLPFRDVIGMIKQVARRSGDNLSSMLQDVLRGARTEIDAINGKVVLLGEARNMTTTLNKSMWFLINSLSERGKINGIIAGNPEEIRHA